MIGILKTTLQNIDKDFFCINNINLLTQHNINSCLFCDGIANDFILPIQTNILQRINIFNYKI